jgi:hypothetical protein
VRKSYPDSLVRKLRVWARDGKRTNQMRYDLGVWYGKFREALRQAEYSLGQ